VLEVLNTSALLAFKRPLGTPSPLSPSKIRNAYPRPDHPVHPALEDGRRHAPPVGVDDYDPICRDDLTAMLHKI